MTTPAKIEDYLLITIDEDFKPKVQTCIDAVTSYIERYTGRTFSADESATPKVYDGSDSGELFIDDAVEVTGVSIDGSILEESEYKLYPSNRLPKTRIILPYRIFCGGSQNVSVTAKWGYGEEIPEDLSFAATLLVADIINASDTSGSGDVASETIGRYSVTYAVGSNSSQSSPEAINAHGILKMYRRMT